MKLFIALALLAALPGPHPRANFHGGLVEHNKYRHATEIHDVLVGQQTAYGTKVINVGHLRNMTFEGREIPFVKITGTAMYRKRIFIETGIHAREWIAPAATLYFIDRLLARRNLDADAKEMFEKFDWYIAPLINPDGYEYTHEQTADRRNRYWRKNRRITQVCGLNEHGVDLNRNFDANFGGPGSSNICKDEIYRGTSAFSEAETWALRDKVEEIIRDDGPISAFISLSAYGQNLFTPYSYTSTLPGEYHQMMSISTKACDAILAATGKLYGAGAGGSHYPASGTGTDWAYMKANIPYSVAFTLRPEIGDSRGFELLAPEIPLTGMDVWAGIYAIATNL